MDVAHDLLDKHIVDRNGHELGRVDGIVLEHDRPSLARRFSPDAALGLERDERLDVVAHDPGQWYVRGGLREVREIEQPVAPRLEQHTLMMRRVTWCAAQR